MALNCSSIIHAGERALGGRAVSRIDSGAPASWTGVLERRPQDCCPPPGRLWQLSIRIHRRWRRYNKRSDCSVGSPFDGCSIFSSSSAGSQAEGNCIFSLPLLDGYYPWRGIPIFSRRVRCPLANGGARRAILAAALEQDWGRARLA